MFILEALGCGLLIIGMALIMMAMYGDATAPLADDVAKFFTGLTLAGLGAITLLIRFVIWFFSRWAGFEGGV